MKSNRIAIHILFIFAAWACVACGKTKASPQTKDDVKYEVGIYEIVPFSEANFPAFPQYDDYQKAKEIEEVLPYRDFYVYSDTAVVNTIIALNNIEEMGYKHVWLPKKIGNANACELVIYKSLPLLSEKVNIKEIEEIPNDKDVLQLFFTLSDKERFATITKANINKKLAMSVNGEIVYVPTVMNEIPSGNYMIIIPKSTIDR